MPKISELTETTSLNTTDEFVVVQSWTTKKVKKSNIKTSFATTKRVLGRKTTGAGEAEECTTSEILDFLWSPWVGAMVYKGASGWEILWDNYANYYLKIVTTFDGDVPVWVPIATLNTDLWLWTAATKNTWTTNGTVPLIGAWDKLSASIMPSVTISEHLGNFTDTTAALADAGVLASQRGDWFTVDTNWGETYIVISDSPTTTSHIKILKTPTGSVSSVNWNTWVVVLDQDDIGDGTTYKQYSATDKTKLAWIETAADVTDAANVWAVNAAASSKATPVDADSFPIVDSEASNVIKRLTFTNLKAFLKTYFDTLYTWWSSTPNIFDIRSRL